MLKTSTWTSKGTRRDILWRSTSNTNMTPQGCGKAQIDECARRGCKTQLRPQRSRKEANLARNRRSAEERKREFEDVRIDPLILLQRITRKDKAAGAQKEGIQHFAEKREKRKKNKKRKPTGQLDEGRQAKARSPTSRSDGHKDTSHHSHQQLSTGKDTCRQRDWKVDQHQDEALRTQGIQMSPVSMPREDSLQKHSHRAGSKLTGTGTTPMPQEEPVLGEKETNARRSSRNHPTCSKNAAHSCPHCIAPVEKAVTGLHAATTA